MLPLRAPLLALCLCSSLAAIPPAAAQETNLTWALSLGLATPGDSQDSAATRAALGFAGLPQSPSDKQITPFRSQAQKGWTTYEKQVGQPLQTWAKKAVGYSGGGTVFYPFAGPDFPAVARVFPGADRYVLVAIQHARQPAQLEKMPPAQQQVFEKKLGKAWEQFGRLAYFRTDDLDRDQIDRNTGLGITTILMAFAARLGYTVTSAAPLTFNADQGEWEAMRPDQPWRSVRLVLKKDGRTVNLDYLRVDLSDHGLNGNEARREWIKRMAGKPTLLKAASHLLQEPSFTILRDALIAQAPLVVQDETGLDYSDLAKIGKPALYGRFVTPQRLFKRTQQKTLAAAYAAERQAGELPFAFSYLKDVNQRSIQVVKRAGK